MDVYVWYRIPGFDGYQINKQTGEIRSFKNFKSDPYHIKAIDKRGYVTLYRDIDGARVTRKPEWFYNLTFNEGNPLDPVSNLGVYMGGRNKMSKQQASPIQMDFFQFVKKD